MSKYVAYEWDEQELRVVAGSPRAGGLQVDRMQIVPLGSEGDDAGSSKDDVPPQLAKALKSANLGKLDALAVINRSRVELKQISLPPAPDDEFPTLVRFQAMREFAKLSEDWPLDFLPLAKPPVSEGHEETQPVLAAAIPPEMLADIQTANSEAGLNLSHVVLRPCGSASLFLRRPESAEHRLVVLIDIEDNEADITVLHGRDPVLLRSARLAQNVLHEDAPAGSLLGEIRRTLPAAHNLVRGERVSAIFLSGATEGHKRLAELIQSTLELPCTAFDPFSQVEVARGAHADTANPAVFAPLLGALLDEVEEAPHSFDFLNPRKPPAPPNQRKMLATYGGIAAGVLALLIGAYWLTINYYENEAAKIQDEIDSYGDLDAALAERNQIHTPIQNFVNHDIDWLNEMLALSTRLEPEDAELDSLTFSANDKSADNKVGNIAMTGRASRQAEPLLYGKLKDARHDVDPGAVTELEDEDARFPLQFSYSVIVTNASELPPDDNQADGNVPAKSADEDTNKDAGAGGAGPQ